MEVDKEFFLENGLRLIDYGVFILKCEVYIILFFWDLVIFVEKGIEGCKR